MRDSISTVVEVTLWRKKKEIFRELFEQIDGVETSFVRHILLNAAIISLY